MRNIVNEIRNEFLVDGENEKYLEHYESYESLVNEGDLVLEKVERSLSKGEDVESLDYPIIFFDDANSESGQVYQSKVSFDYVIDMASEYFKRK